MSRLFLWGILAVAALAAFLYWSNKSIAVTEYAFESSKVPEAFDGFRIVQVSDLQSEYFGKDQGRLLEKVEAARPDIIVFTGDLADRNHTDYEASLTAAQGLAEIAPVYYVNGNHELALPLEDISQMYDELEKAGVHLLLDRGALLERNRQCIYLAGLSEETVYESKLRGGAISEGSVSRGKVSDTDIDGDYLAEELKELRNGGDAEDFSILLAHEPQFIETYALGNFDLIFSGHAHGGQIRLPFTQGLFAPGQGILPKLTAGMHTLGETSMVISRGLGNSTFPFRIFNRPEVVVCRLSFLSKQ